jgi:hypothetical protein
MKKRWKITSACGEGVKPERDFRKRERFTNGMDKFQLTHVTIFCA